MIILTLVSTLILELTALLVLSDIINLVLKQNQSLRLNDLIQILVIEKYRTHTYLALLLTTYVALTLVQSKYLTLIAQIAYNLSSELYSSLRPIPYEVFQKIKHPKFQALLVPETQRAASSVIIPAFNLVAKLLLVLLIFIVLFIELGSIVFFGLLVSIPYITMIFLVSNILIKNGKKFSTYQVKRQSIINKTFEANKVLFIYDIYDVLEREFVAINTKMGKILGLNNILSQIPRYAIELLIGISLLLYYYTNSFSGETEVFKNASLVLVAAMKLIPNFQQIYRSYSNIIANYSSLDNIISEKNAISEQAELFMNERQKKKVHYLEVENLRTINADLHINEKIVNIKSIHHNKSSVNIIRGKSGIGKTTFLDNLIGLRGDIEIQSGTVSHLYSLEIGKKEANVSYSPQEKFYDIDLINTFLSAKSNLSEYIIDEVAIEWEISDILQNILKKREVGELSGGQKRKLSIIFSLINDGRFIFLDEPTNDLDTKSKQTLLKLISFLQTCEKTIYIISHDDELILDDWNILWLTEKN